MINNNTTTLLYNRKENALEISFGKNKKYFETFAAKGYKHFLISLSK